MPQSRGIQLDFVTCPGSSSSRAGLQGRSRALWAGRHWDPAQGTCLRGVMLQGWAADTVLADFPSL